MRKIIENTAFRSIAVGFIIAVSGTYLFKMIDYNWQWYRIGHYFFEFGEHGFTKGMLIDGLIVTLKISVISLFFTMIIGFSSALMRLSSSPVLKWLMGVYVEGVRNTPLLIQLFVIYFVISPVIGLSPFASAVAALSLFEGAYASEIVRTGIINVPKTQWEACWSSGLSGFDSFFHVILPQALNQILPMLAGQGVSLIKDSALVSTISIYDLTMSGQSIVSDTFLTFEIWFAVAFCYFVISAFLSMMISSWERRISFKR